MEVGRNGRAQEARPLQERLVLALTLPHAFRLVGFVFAGAAVAGAVPFSGVFGGVGDGVVGLGAILVALALWRRPGYASWMAAIAWNVYGATDVLFANAIQVFAPDSRPQPFALFLVPLFFLTAHLVNLRLLTGETLRCRYLGNAGSGTAA